MQMICVFASLPESLIGRYGSDTAPRITAGIR